MIPRDKLPAGSNGSELLGLAAAAEWIVGLCAGLHGVIGEGVIAGRRRIFLFHVAGRRCERIGAWSCGVAGWCVARGLSERVIRRHTSGRWRRCAEWIIAWSRYDSHFDFLRTWWRTSKGNPLRRAIHGLCTFRPTAANRQ